MTIHDVTQEIWRDMFGMRPPGPVIVEGVMVGWVDDGDNPPPFDEFGNLIGDPA